MGIKTTQRLTRAEAISRYADFKAEIKRRKWEAQATAMTNAELESALDQMSDEAFNVRHNTHGGGFDNFAIVDDGEQDG